MPHQRVESGFDQTSELQFVQHGYSLTTPKTPKAADREIRRWAGVKNTGLSAPTGS
jgi:hypothetical protein